MLYPEASALAHYISPTYTAPQTIAQKLYYEPSSTIERPWWALLTTLVCYPELVSFSIELFNLKFEDFEFKKCPVGLI